MLIIPVHHVEHLNPCQRHLLPHEYQLQLLFPLEKIVIFRGIFQQEKIYYLCDLSKQI